MNKMLFFVAFLLLFTSIVKADEQLATSSTSLSGVYGGIADLYGVQTGVSLLNKSEGIFFDLFNKTFLNGSTTQAISLTSGSSFDLATSTLTNGKSDFVYLRSLGGPVYVNGTAISQLSPIGLYGTDESTFFTLQTVDFFGAQINEIRFTISNIAFRSLGGISSAFYYSADIQTQVLGVSAVPEPETYAMMLMGAGVIGFMARRRKNTQV